MRIILARPGGLSVIIRVLTRGTEEVKVRGEAMTVEAKSREERRFLAVGCEGGGWGHEPRKAALLEAGKSRKQICSWSLQKEHSSNDTMTLASWAPGLQSYGVVSVCTLSVW